MIFRNIVLGHGFQLFKFLFIFAVLLSWIILNLMDLKLIIFFRYD